MTSDHMCPWSTEYAKLGGLAGHVRRILEMSGKKLEMSLIMKNYFWYPSYDILVN